MANMSMMASMTRCDDRNATALQWAHGVASLLPACEGNGNTL